MNLLDAALAGHMEALGNVNSVPETGGSFLELVVMLGTFAVGSHIWDSWRDSRNRERSGQPQIGFDEALQTAVRRMDELKREEAELVQRGVSAQQMDWESLVRQSMEKLQTYRHAMFAPGKMEEITDAVEQAREFTEQGASQAAAAAWYQAYQLARNTEGNVLRIEKVWYEAQSAYITQYQELRDMIALCGAFPQEFTTTEGKEIIELDVDYWTEGAVKALESALPDENVAEDCPLEEIQIRTRLVREAVRQVQELSETAVRAFVDSQQRIELCETVYQAFEDRGWEVVDLPGFENDDMRRDIRLSMRSAVKDAVQFTFSRGGRINADVNFHEVYNRGLFGYLAGVLRQALAENQIVVEEMTSAQP